MRDEVLFYFRLDWLMSSPVSLRSSEEVSTRKRDSGTFRQGLLPFSSKAADSSLLSVPEAFIPSASALWLMRLKVWLGSVKRSLRASASGSREVDINAARHRKR